MRKLSMILAIVSCSCMWTAPSSGQQVAVPLLRHFIEESQLDPEEPYDVLRMDLDLNGDGILELLLAKAHPAIPTGLQGWFVYTRVGDHEYRPWDGREFSFLLFRVDQARLIVYSPGLKALLKYRVDAAGFHEESRQPAAGPESDAFKAWRETVRLKVLSVKLSELRTSTDPVWTDLLTRAVVPDVGNFAGYTVVP